MSEPSDIRTMVLVNQAKRKAAQAYGEAFEASLYKLAEALAAEGYRRDEITQALEFTAPMLVEGMDKVLRSITEDAIAAGMISEVGHA